MQQSLPLGELHSTEKLQFRGDQLQEFKGSMTMTKVACKFKHKREGGRKKVLEKLSKGCRPLVCGMSTTRSRF